MGSAIIPRFHSISSATEQWGLQMDVSVLKHEFNSIPIDVHPLQFRRTNPMTQINWPVSQSAAKGTINVLEAINPRFCYNEIISSIAKINIRNLIGGGGWENSYWSEITLSELVVKIPSAMMATIEEAVCDWRKITESILFGPSRHPLQGWRRVSGRQLLWPT